MAGETMVSYANQAGTKAKIRRLFGRKGKFKIAFASKAGAPTNNTHYAQHDGDLLINTSADDVYVASNVNTSTPTTTWTKIID